jgi:spore maturation protein CgeB
MRIVILGLSITSSWGNGHATTYRGLVRALAARGHDILFLERDTPWYASNRDLPSPPFGETHLYGTLPELEEQWGDAVKTADLVVVGSYVPDGIAVGEWAVRTARGITAFYDIDTPVTLAQLARNECTYLSPSLLPRYELYLSFAGGKVLETLETQWQARRARPFLCAFDPDIYYPAPTAAAWDLGYLGTYSDDRQPALSRLLLQAAQQWPQGRFCVAGPQYPSDIDWPANVTRIEHLPPAEHRAFYNSQRFALNITRADMIALGWSPSVRLFEAAACAVPVISDWWAGLDNYFTPGKEILISRAPEETLHFLRDLPEDERLAIGAAARARALGSHTAAHRAQQLEQYLGEARTG